MLKFDEFLKVNHLDNQFDLDSEGNPKPWDVKEYEWRYKDEYLHYINASIEDMRYER